MARVVEPHESPETRALAAPPRGRVSPPSLATDSGINKTRTRRNRLPAGAGSRGKDPHCSPCLSRVFLFGIRSPSVSLSSPGCGVACPPCPQQEEEESLTEAQQSEASGAESSSFPLQWPVGVRVQVWLILIPSSLPVQRLRWGCFWEGLGTVIRVESSVDSVRSPLWLHTFGRREHQAAPGNETHNRDSGRSVRGGSLGQDETPGPRTGPDADGDTDFVLTARGPWRPQ